MNENNKFNCNIIKDLLPSYLEGICSQDTKNIVDEHLRECDACRQLKDLLQETELISDQTECRQINYIKKSKHHFIKLGAFSTILLAALVLTGLIASAKNNIYSANIYYVFLPVLLLITRAVIPMPVHHEPVQRLQKITALVSAACTLYAFILTAAILYSLYKYQFLPFHLTPDQAGPFIDIQLTAIILLQAVFYITGLFYILKGKNVSFSCMGIYLTGGFLALRLMTFLRQLTDLSLLYKTLIIPVIFLLLEGICTILLLSVLQGTLQKNKL